MSEEPRPALSLVPPLDGARDWRDDALCHGMYEMFDLQELTNAGQMRTVQRRDDAYRVRAARNVCYECPVFQECWDEALVEMPTGVIRAGARLGNIFLKKREEAMNQSMARYVEYQRTKGQTS